MKALAELENTTLALLLFRGQIMTRGLVTTIGTLLLDGIVHLLDNELSGIKITDDDRVDKPTELVIPDVIVANTDGNTLIREKQRNDNAAVTYGDILPILGIGLLQDGLQGL
jgi:hypothetical protein